MKILNAYPIHKIDHLTQPHHLTNINLESAASEVFLDFHHAPPSMIDADTQAIGAQEMMRHEHCAIKMVIDRDEDLIGIITQEALSPQAITQHQNKFTPKGDITVADLMSPRDQLIALDFQQLLSSTVGDILNTLKLSGLSHCLVVDNQQHEIRGLVDAADIAERLHIPAPQTSSKPSFLSIFKYLGGKRLAQ
ncbi:histidine kinase [Shewanella sp. NIFS-20-20]|uniref:histidine kinase n=1 Tax=Shewanella sp. NIFS-20-20 TaxID=2853806 RepID=UPI001C43EEA8|nr:histidine kinase [Shewanella sp. NIFS-20-20]MBV7314720.1 histidine kinase [Shewanella sp. NIFS-20-20]